MNFIKNLNECEPFLRTIGSIIMAYVNDLYMFGQCVVVTTILKNHW